MKFKNIISKKGITSLQKIILTFISGLIISTVVAQTNVQIGSSTNNSGVVPIRTDLDYSYTQQIYTATELINAGVTGQSTISKLKFFLTTNNTTNSTDWTIYMGNTTKTEFLSDTDWEPISYFTTNFTGTVVAPVSGNWMEIILDVPFIWNGVDNIIIAIDQNQPSSSTINSDWQITTKTENRSIYYFSSSINADPASPPTASGVFNKVNNIQFEVSPVNNGFNQSPGNALNFNGSNGYCTSSLPTLFDNIGTTDFTVESWVKLASNTTTSRIFFAQKNSTNFCTILISAGHVPYIFLTENGTVHSINTQVTLSSTEWSHIAFTWDASSNTIVCYINGVEVNGISGGTSSIGNDQSMTIGARTDGSQKFAGSIDELRIWSDIRTPCEINAAMNSDFTTPQPNLIALYNFNQGIAGGTNTGITTLSELNNNYNGTLNGFLLTGTSSNWIASEASIITSNNTSETQYLYDPIEACESYTWINNVNYTTSNNTATFTSTNPAGCTVVENLDLTINLPSTSIDNVIACETFTWIDNLTYTSSNNTATHTIIGGSSNGCDSIVTLNLTINQPTTGIDVQTACESYTWIDNVTYTASNNTATHTITGGAANGCDSTVTLNLTINTVDITVTDNSPTLIANNTSATSYQWMDCATDLELNGETNATYDADLNGSYAVIVTENGCTDTSNCIIVNNVNLDDLTEREEFIKIYPNPTTGKVYMEFDHLDLTKELRIVDITGKQVMMFQPNSNKIEINLDLKPGSYFIHYKEGVYRLVVN